MRYLCCIRDKLWVELPYRWFTCRLNLWLVIFCSTFRIAGLMFLLAPFILIVTCETNLTPGDKNKALLSCVNNVD